MYEKSFTDKDLEIIRNLEYEQFAEFSTRSCCYSKLVIKMYSEMLWQESMDKQFQLDGFNDSPKVSCTKLVFPTNTSRKIETLVLSFLYPNNLMNEFLYRYDKSEFFSPLCVCEEGEQNSKHLLVDCCQVDVEKRTAMRDILECTPFHHLSDYGANQFLISWSRIPEFFALLIDIVKEAEELLRFEIVL